jgi:hypothetical protein
LENLFLKFDGVRKRLHIAHIVKDALLIALSISCGRSHTARASPR